MTEKPNIVVVMFDTLRAAHVGCYGNREMRTPHLDAFAQRSTRFTRAFPESLPTIPVRRALHTGRRAFPFRDYKHLKWGTVRLPGWQPMADEEDTLAETLADNGYHTGFVCTTQHCWNPGYNFQRGFWQWEFARGYSGEDKWGSPFGVPREAMVEYGDPDTLLSRPYAGGGAPMVLANRGLAMVDEQTATAKAFQWAARFLEDNQRHPFYLLIDSFAPHEPWEAPREYYLMYGDPNYRGTRYLGSCYGPADRYSNEEIGYIKANYAGLVTHCDRWFGQFMATLDALGLAQNTAVIVTSDHGTNFCENPRNVIGKPSNSMYHGVMDLPLLVRLPDEAGAETTCDTLVYNHDTTATVYDLAGLESRDGIDGQSLLPLTNGDGHWRSREYVTCRYANSLCYIDGRTWALGDIDGEVQELFDLDADPDCREPLPEQEARARWAPAWRRLLDDAGGVFPDYRGGAHTDALGRPLNRGA